jgi:hypothetical protein
MLFRCTEDLPGLCFSSMQWAMMIKAPENSPAAPRPATALPMIKAILEGATAHTRLPSSNMPRNKMKVHFRLKFWNSLPPKGWQAQVEIRKAEPYLKDVSRVSQGV